MAEPQTFKDHTRFDPRFHFSLIPLLLLNLICSIVWTVRHYVQHPHIGFWLIGMALVLVYMALLTRMYATQNQDRIIRLEERLRLASLLPASDAGLVAKITARQFVALRFASDAELPALARRAVTENLASRQIKESIQQWRPDYDRI